MRRYRLNDIEELEAEAIYAIREAGAQFERPCILFSGGKDSIVLSHLAVKAFAPDRVPIPLVHIDTGHNFPETIVFRDQFVKALGLRIEVALVQDSIDEGKISSEYGIEENRNRAQSVTLLDFLSKNGYDAALGGGRRDEEKARAKERFFSHRDHKGQWNPRNQRAELWNLFNGYKRDGEHFRVFPISNWTELDVWRYIQRENIVLPSLYFSHQRRCVRRAGVILSDSEHLTLRPGEVLEILSVRFRTLGDITITGAIESSCSNIADIIDELSMLNQTERGQRVDDQHSESAMEDRKKEGYF
jgi:sulfate adenylyltransferase subunit 2